MRPNRLLLFITVFLFLLAMPVLAIEIVLEGDRKVTAGKVTYENGKFNIVSGTAMFNVQASKVEFLKTEIYN